MCVCVETSFSIAGVSHLSFLVMKFPCLTTPPQHLLFQLFTPHILSLLEFPFSLQSFFLVLGLSFTAFGLQNTLTPCCRNNPKHWTSTNAATFPYCSMAEAPNHLATSPIPCFPQPGIRPNPFCDAMCFGAYKHFLILSPLWTYFDIINISILLPRCLWFQT